MNIRFGAPAHTNAVHLLLAPVSTDLGMRGVEQVNSDWLFGFFVIV
jgi:hypothetical protein